MSGLGPERAFLAVNQFVGELEDHVNRRGVRRRRLRLESPCFPQGRRRRVGVQLAVEKWSMSPPLAAQDAISAARKARR